MGLASIGLPLLHVLIGCYVYRDGNGTITLTELREALKKKGAKLADEEVRSVFLATLDSPPLTPHPFPRSPRWRSCFPTWTWIGTAA